MIARTCLNVDMASEDCLGMAGESWWRRGKRERAGRDTEEEGRERRARVRETLEDVRASI